jgi:hypothetical protein
MVEISDFCQYPGCKKRTAVWVQMPRDPNGLAACAEHEPWLIEQVDMAIYEEEEESE